MDHEEYEAPSIEGFDVTHLDSYNDDVYRSAINNHSDDEYAPKSGTMADLLSDYSDDEMYKNR